MRKVATAVAGLVALIGVPTIAAAATPVPSWAGFCLDFEFGASWSGAQAVNYSPNDRAAAMLLNSGGFLGGEQPVPNGFRISRTSPIGGFEAGYNWQAGSNWLLGLETDFSLSDLSGQMGGSSNFGPGFTQSITAKQSTDWYGTVRASAGFLATPNLLLFGTGGFAYGRVANSASFLIVDPPRRLWRWRGCWGCIILVPEWCDVHCRKFVRGAHRLDRGRRGGMAA